MGAERRPRGHRRRRDAQVRLSGAHPDPPRRESPPLSPPSRGRTLEVLPARGRMANDASRVAGSLSNSCNAVLPLEGGDGGGSLSPRTMSDVSSTMRLSTTTTRLTRTLSRALNESKSGAASCSAAAKCVAMRSQRIHEMRHRDSGLHHIVRPLAGLRIPLRGRRNNASRRAAQR
jgi:hypothetical protein